MNQEMSRTERFAMHEENITFLRNKAIDCRTLARGYRSLVDILEAAPSQGDLWDAAQQDLIQLAKDRANGCDDKSKIFIARADDLDAKGID